jgi:hypothetical protein
VNTGRVATVCSIASILLAVPEVVTAVGTLLGRRKQDTKAATHANRYNGEKYRRFSTAVLGVQQLLSPIENDCTYFMQLLSLNIPSIISDRTSHV